MKPTQFLAALLTTLALTATSANAEQINASYNKAYGGSFTGGSVSVVTVAEASHDLELDTSSAYAEANFSKKVKLLGATHDVLRVEAWAEAERVDGQVSHDQNFRVSLIGGIAVWDSEDGGLALNLPTLSVFPGAAPKFPVPCGPFTVKIKVNAGVDGDLGLEVAADNTTGSVALTGFARGWAQGTASASANIGGVAEVGVKAKLKLANLRTDLNVLPAPGALEGTMGIVMTPITIDLDAYVKLILPFVPDPTYKANILEWSAAQFSNTYPLN